MSRDGSVDLDWADGRYRFRLPIGGLRELQEKTGVGPLELLRRIRDGAWFVDDLRETVRIGLIHGGTDPATALGLVRRYVDERPLNESIAPAALVLGAAVIGAKDEPVGKPPAGDTTMAGASPAFTETAPSSDGRHPRSTD